VEDRLTLLAKLPKGAYQTVALARWCFPFSEAKPFPGAVVYFKEWGIWNALDEEMGMCAVRSMRAAHGEKRGLWRGSCAIFFRG